MLQCLFDICSVDFTHNSILVHTQGGNQRANNSALELLVGSKVANELQFCSVQPNIHGREGEAELLTHLTGF